MATERPIAERTAAVIPAYNAAHHLERVLDGVARHLPRERIVVVDDGSSDDSFGVARRAGVAAVQHERNLGKGAALGTGIAKAAEIGAEYAITLDADEQHDPDDIPAFLRRWGETRADIIVGNRLETPAGMPALRLWTNHVTSWAVSLLARARIPDSQNGYRMIRAGLYAQLGVRSVRYEAESELLIRAGRAGARIASVPVRTIYGAEQSAINPLVDTGRFLRLVFKSFFW
ncbi:MAG: glycosyltransferase family 2 protein [Candidatus Krumholzibacteria bacterium]|nr:glycosyltransferase family 2 protein [Candidatus Krumholzibacteria bacterium]